MKTLFAITLLMFAGLAQGQVSSPSPIPVTSAPTNCYGFYALTTASPWTIYAPTTGNGCQTIGSGGGGGDVTSVFGRTGDVVAVTGDYTFGQEASGTALNDGYVLGNGTVLTTSGTGINNANEQNGVLYSSLATGLMKNTTTTGVPSIAVAGTDYVGLASANTLSGVNTFSGSAAASSSPFVWTCAPFTGGTSTTNFPCLFWNQSPATAVTTWASGGTFFGANAASGSGADWINFNTNGVLRFRVTQAGMLTAIGMVNASGNTTIGLASAGVTITNSTAGSVPLTVNNSAATPSADIVDFQANTVKVGGVAKDGGAIHPSYNQIAASNTGGTCAMVAGTSCAITLSHTYTTPVCIATQQSATLTGGAVGCTVSGTTVTITSAVLNSETWGAFVFGNPN